MSSKCIFTVILAVVICAALVLARPEPQANPILAEPAKPEKIQNLDGEPDQSDLKGASSYGYGFYGGYYPYYGYYGGYPYYGGLDHYKFDYPHYGGYHGLYGHHYY